MDNKSTTKRMIGAVVLVLIAALLLAWLLKGKNQSVQKQQELIAEQTQEASPILGFPGVNEGDEAAEGQTAQNGEATGDGSYVIGSADQNSAGAADGDGNNNAAQQQVQNALAAGTAATAATVAAGQAVADGAKEAGSAASGAATQAGQQVANATGFQVRDSGQSTGDDGEQRPIVEDGEVKAGTGSMGGTEVAAGSGSDGDSTQAVAAAGAGAGAATQSSGGDSGSGSAAQQTQTASSGSGSGSNAGSGSSSGGNSAAKPAKKIANPKLVNEKPVPAPRTQSASSKKRSGSGSSASRNSASASSSAASGSGSSSSGSAANSGGSGYAIQVLAASKRSTAENLKKDIARDGYPVFVVRARVNGKTVYRVRVGTYPAKGDARAVQTRMKARYTKNQYVQNSFVTRN